MAGAAGALPHHGHAVRGLRRNDEGQTVRTLSGGPYPHADPPWHPRDADRAHAAPGAAFHLLAIVNHPRLARSERDWRLVRDRLRRAWEFGGIGHPVRLSVESLERVNDALVEGVPHFISIANAGIALYQMEGLRLAKPCNLPASERRMRGLAEYACWYERASDFLIGAAFCRDRGNPPMAALLLHQACEHLYQCLLRSLTLHGPRTHALDELRQAAEAVAPCLRSVWPRTSRFERRAFGCIRRAYVEVRYGHGYRISSEELAWAMERVAMLQRLVRDVCVKRLEIESRPTCFAPPLAQGGGHVLAQ